MAKQHYPYIYSSSELGKYFGITIKGIEYYEKKGLIKPSRVGNSKQRRFNLMETYRIWMTRYLRQIGFNVDQTLALLNAKQPATAQASFADMIDKLKSQQMRLNVTIQVLERHLDLLRKLEVDSSGELEPSPSFKWLFLRSMDRAHDSNDRQSKEYREWNELMPITDASIKYKLSDVLSTDTDLEPEIGMVVTSENFKKFGLSESVRVKTIPSQTCLHVILAGDSQQVESREWLQPAIDYIHSNQLQLQGDVVTSLLLVLDNDETHIRFDEAWLPVGK